MRYIVTINRKYQYIKVYNTLKKVNESSNPLSRAVSAFVDKLMRKNKAPGA